MKHLFKTVTNCKSKTMVVPFLNYLKRNTATKLCSIILAASFMFTSCTKQDLNQSKDETNSLNNASIKAEADLNIQSDKTLQELEQARRATERYKDINNAIADGYVDINVVMENMGYHYEKVSIVDSVFDVTQPELLVYNKNEDGSFRLVAVEYAVPLDQSTEAPKGFTGKQDVWDHNDGFGLWLLHAWVWDYNPDGVFNPTNPRVHVLQ